MKAINKMRLTVSAKSINESFCRSVVGAFASQINPTIDEVNDIKTAVSEAVTNCVVHAYGGKGIGEITIEAILYENAIEVSILDNGVGIADVEKAMQPFYTTKPGEERSGMGFTVMQSFMDSMRVEKNKGKGIVVHLAKVVGIKQGKEQREDCEKLVIGG